jgi:GntR family transcriptional regulator, transcriptional repressor for pyruvate dehydrogenase complex
MIFEPLKRKRTSELIIEKIKQSIFAGQFKPGDKLPSERALALQLNVGRPVVREALRAVEASGILMIKPGVDGGSIVREPNTLMLMGPLSDMIHFGSVTIDNLAEAGLLFEKSVIEAVMKKHTAGQYRELEDLLKVASKKIRRGERATAENALFHKMLAEMCHNPIVTNVVDAINSAIAAFVKPLRPPLLYEKRIVEGHRGILLEMKNGNIEKAKERYDEHIAYFSEELRRLARLRKVDFNRTNRNGLS